MAWTKPKYNSSRRNSAGRNLAEGVATPEDLEVINNWRAAHSAPLQTIKMLLKNRAQALDRRAVIAQRLKRMPSIQLKLEREPTMRLSQMQDIGGCRAVVRNLQQVKELQRKFVEGMAKSPGRHGTRQPKDYVADPKADGYRSVHFVLRYSTGSPHLACFRGQLVEVQIRSRLQHAWATAVEIVDILTGQSLKTSLKSQLGDSDWKRFFQLMGSAIALTERSPLVPGTPTVKSELREELRFLNDKLGAATLLQGFGAAVNIDRTAKGSYATYILELDTATSQTTVHIFDRSEVYDADVLYSVLEQRHSGNGSVNIVQVQVENLEMLRVAYPNYYLDTTYFVETLESAVK